MQIRTRALYFLLACLLVLAVPRPIPAQEAGGQQEESGIRATVQDVAAQIAKAGIPSTSPAAADAAAMGAVGALEATGDVAIEVSLGSIFGTRVGDVANRLAQEADRPRLELSLQDAIEMALRYNLQVRVSRYSQESSFESIMSARAQFDPQLNFQTPSSFRRSTNPQTVQTAGADVLTSENLSGGVSFSENLKWGTSWSASWTANRSTTNNEFATFNPTLGSNLGFQVQQPLLRGFGSVNETGILVAENNYQGSQEQFRSQVQQQIQQTYNAYWGMVGAVRALEVSQESLDLAEEQLRRNTIQVEIGTLAPIETVQAQRQAENSRLSLIQAQNQLENAQDNLKRLLNLPTVRDDWADVFIVPTDEPDDTVESIDLEEAIATAVENDPGLRQQRIGLENSRLQLNNARNNLLPNVNVSANLSFAGRGGNRFIRSSDLGGEVSEVIEGGIGDALAQVFSGDFNTWSLGVTVQMPLHNWQARAQHAQASISERQQVVGLQQQEQQVVFNVRTAVRNLESGAQQVRTAQRAREFAQQQLDAEQRKFEVGTSTNFQVLTFQSQLSSAQLSEVQAILNFVQARAQLEAAKGTLLQYFGVSVQEAGRDQ